MGENYLANWVQSLFYALGAEVQGKTLALGGDGRYFGKEAAQIIIKLAAGNGFKKVVVGQDAIIATPAMSALIRRRKLYGKRDQHGGRAWGTMRLSQSMRCNSGRLSRTGVLIMPTPHSPAPLNPSHDSCQVAS